MGHKFPVFYIVGTQKQETVLRIKSLHLKRVKKEEKNELHRFLLYFKQKQKKFVFRSCLKKICFRAKLPCR